MVRAHQLVVTLAVLASQPLVATMFGGQTVAFSLLCLAGGYSALRRERELAAGVWLGLLLYKPPLIVPLLLLLLWHRRWRTVVVAGLVGLALALAGVMVAGPDWPFRFVDLAGGAFAKGDAAANGMNMISLLGVSEQLFGASSLWARTVAALLGLGAVALLIRIWWRASLSEEAFPLQYGFALVVTLLLSPHALYYETGLLILPILMLLDRWRVADAVLAPARRLGLVCLFACGYLWPLGALLGVQLLIVVPITIGVLLWRALGNARSVAPATVGRHAAIHPSGLGRITYVDRRESAHDRGVGET
jgi:hypothetical protein